jgi:hypothetical protein
MPPPVLSFWFKLSPQRPISTYMLRQPYTLDQRVLGLVTPVDGL